MPCNLAVWKLQAGKHPPTILAFGRTAIEDDLNNPWGGIEEGTEIVNANRLWPNRLIETPRAFASRDHIPERDSARDQRRTTLGVARLWRYPKQLAKDRPKGVARMTVILLLPQ